MLYSTSAFEIYSRKYILWQVMYDAFGVRLHAGRQAEVWCFPLSLFCLSSSNHLHPHPKTGHISSCLDSDILVCSCNCISMFYNVNSSQLQHIFWRSKMNSFAMSNWISSGFESNCLRTSCWTSSCWEQAPSWTSWTHPYAGYVYSLGLPSSLIDIVKYNLVQIILHRYMLGYKTAFTNDGDSWMFLLFMI